MPILDYKLTDEQFRQAVFEIEDLEEKLRGVYARVVKINESPPYPLNENFSWLIPEITKELGKRELKKWRLQA